jgi:hypothetical protein
MTTPAEQFSRPPADKHAVLQSCAQEKTFRGGHPARSESTACATQIWTPTCSCLSWRVNVLRHPTPPHARADPLSTHDWVAVPRGLHPLRPNNSSVYPRHVDACGVRYRRTLVYIVTSCSTFCWLRTAPSSGRRWPAGRRRRRARPRCELAPAPVALHDQNKL